MIRGVSTTRIANTYRLAWLPLPSDKPYSFAYEGRDAERAAKELSQTLREVILETQDLADQLWGEMVRVTLDNPKNSPLVKQMRARAIQEIMVFAKATWMRLASILRRYSYLEQNPTEARVAVSLPLEHMYRQLADKVDAYVSGDIRALYTNLSSKVDGFFTNV